MSNRRDEIVSEIIKHKDEMNALFEEAASYYIKFEGSFKQDQSFGEGLVAHLNLKAFLEISV